MSDSVASIASDVEEKPSTLEGRLEKLRGRSVIGWVVNHATPDARVQLDILIDGVVATQVTADRYRKDLERAGKGDGHRGFIAKIPSEFFAGEICKIEAVEAVTGQKFGRNSREFLLEAKLGAGPEISIVGIHDGKLFGFAQDLGDPDRFLQIELVGPELCIAATALDGPAEPILSALSEQRPHSDLPGDLLDKGFFFDVDEPMIGAIVRGELSVREADSDALVPVPATLAASLVNLVRAEHDDLHAGVLNVSSHINVPIAFDVFVDENFQHSLTWKPSTGRRSFPIYLPSLDRAGQSLSVRFSRSQLEVGGSPAKIVGEAGDLVQNGRFEKWADGRPTGWDVTAPDHVLCIPSAASVLRTRLGDVGQSSLVLVSQGGGLSVEGARLSQALAEKPTENDHLQIFIVAKSTNPASLRVSAVSGSIEQTEQFRADDLKVRELAIGSAPRVQTALLEIDSDASRLVLEVKGETSKVEIMLIALGYPGFQISHMEPASPAPKRDKGRGAPDNAILADFTRWTGALTQTLDGRHIEINEVWNVTSRSPSPKLTISADVCVTRDPSLGINGDRAYAVSIDGSVNGNYARLHASLDPSVLYNLVNPVFKCYLKHVESGQGSPSTVEIIDSISILRRDFIHRDAELIPVESRIATIAKRVATRRLGGFHEFEFSDADKKSVKKACLELLSSPSSELFLVFEFRGQVSFVIASAAIKEKDVQARGKSGAREVGYIGFEDLNLAKQVSVLRGLQGWALPAISASAKPSSAKDSDVSRASSWRWRDKPSSMDIVVPVFNSIDPVMRCLASVEQYTTVPYRLVIVDDCSELNAAEQLKRFAEGRPWVELLRNDANLGYTRSANKGMAASNSEWLVLLNSDTLVTPGWLEGLLAVWEEHPRTAMVGPLSNAASWQSVPELYDANGKWAINALPEGWQPADMAELVRKVSISAYPTVPLLNGFCTLIRRDALEDVGYLDEVAFPIGYGEENDLCVRVADKGYELRIADDVYVFHEKSASFGRMNRNELSKEGTRNFKAKHPRVDLRKLQERLSSLTETALVRQGVNDQSPAQ